MAHSASSSRNQLNVAVTKQPLKSGASFNCYKDDVFKVPADVLVVSNNGSVEACARGKLGYIEWDKKKFKHSSSYISYDWKTVFKIPNSDRKSKLNFNRVYSVQVPPVIKNDKCLEKRWMDEFEKMIKKQLKEADNEKSSSITIPLLGTNAGGAPKDECVRRVIDAVISIEKFQHLQKINLVVQDWPEFTLVQDILAKNASDSEKYHLFSSSSSSSSYSSNHVSGGSKTRSQSSDELKTANRFDISGQQSNTDSYSNGDKSRGDNAQSLLRSKSPESRSVSDSSSHSRQDDYRFDRQNSDKSRGDNAQSLHRSKSPESRSVSDSSSYSRQDDYRFDRQGEIMHTGPRVLNLDLSVIQAHTPDKMTIALTDKILINQGEIMHITYEEGSEKKCYKCNSSLKNRSQIQLRCGHTFCSKCSIEGCKDRICIEDPKGNKVQRSSEQTHEERKDKMSEEKCYGCQSILKNNSPVQLACGHTFCARCASKGCKDPSCEEESFDDDDRPSQAESISSRKISGNHSNKDSHRKMDSKKNGHNYREDEMGYHSNKDSYKKGREDGIGDNHSSKRGRAEREGRDKKDQHAVGAEKFPMCAICMDDITDPKILPKYGHVFCRKCIKDFFKLHKPVCPSCGTIYGITIGNMPAGNMNVHKSANSIEGYRKYGSYCINYTFSSGTQGKEHPNPGVMYFNTSRVAYLPANPEGIEVCKMLKVAFKRRLTFTIGRSTTTGKENVITWNDIHHKTSINGGPTNFGYPDPTYLTRVKEELASKGVTVADIGGIMEGNETLYVP